MNSASRVGRSFSSKAESSSVSVAATSRSASPHPGFIFSIDWARGTSTHGDGTAKTKSNQIRTAAAGAALAIQRLHLNCRRQGNVPTKDEAELLQVEGHEVRVTHPEKLYFACGTEVSKVDLVRYYLAVAPGALLGIRDRPIVLKRFVNGACLATGQPEPFYQKRAPADHPDFLRTVTLAFPSGRTAEELVVDNAAGLAWIVNMGCIELHPHGRPRGGSRSSG